MHHFLFMGFTLGSKIKIVKVRVGIYLGGLYLGAGVVRETYRQHWRVLGLSAIC